MADARVEVVEGRAIAVPFGYDLLEPFIEAAQAAANDPNVVAVGTDLRGADTIGAVAADLATISQVAEAMGSLNTFLAGVAIGAISYGQSNGLPRVPKVTNELVSGAYMFVGGSDPTEFPNFVNSNVLAQTPDNYSSLVALSEPADEEGWGPGTAQRWLEEGQVEQVFFFAPAIGGAGWTSLMPGTGYWTNMSYGMERMAAEANARGLRIEWDLTWTQGEADADTLPPGGLGTEAAVTQAEYVDLLTQLGDDWWRECQLLGQGQRNPPIWVTPLLTQLPDVADNGCRNVQNAQVEAAATLAGIELLPSPCQFAGEYEADLIHMGGVGHRYYAEAATLMKRNRRNGGSQKPLKMLSASRSGQTVTVTMSEAVAIDTSTIAEISAAAFPHQNKGFEFYDRDGTAFVTVSNVSVSGVTVTLTLSGTPLGTDNEIRMSQQRHTEDGAASLYMPRSNIRAVTPLGEATDGTTLHNFAVPQTVDCN